jgi:hypothetical protein
MELGMIKAREEVWLKVTCWQFETSCLLLAYYSILRFATLLFLGTSIESLNVNLIIPFQRERSGNAHICLQDTNIKKSIQIY